MARYRTHPLIIVIGPTQANHYQALAAAYDREHSAAYRREEAHDVVPASNWQQMTEHAEELADAVVGLFHRPRSILSAHYTAHGRRCPLSGAHIDSLATPPGRSPCPNGCDTARILRPDNDIQAMP